LSVVSLWEITIKANLGKLTIEKPLHDILQDQVDQGLQVLPFLTAHVLYVGQLPAHHKDPFDRALIAQAFVEQAWLVSQDAMMTTYTLPILW
jgi:PIN domain nuclease of toxin-antitoxin system